MEAKFLYHNNRELKQRRQRRQRKPQKSNRFILAKQQLCTLVHFLAVVRLVPSRYLSVFWGERRVGIRLRRARGLPFPRHPAGKKIIGSNTVIKTRKYTDLLSNSLNSLRKYKKICVENLYLLDK